VSNQLEDHGKTTRQDRRILNLFTRNELLSGTILAVVGSIVWEWGIKLPLSYVLPSIGTAFVSISHFYDSITEASATYTESFSTIFLITTILAFFFRAISEMASYFIKNDDRRWKLQRITNWSTQIFFVIVASINGYAQLVSHNRIVWFWQSIDIMAPSIADLQIKQLRADWASMTTNIDFERVVQEVEKVAGSANPKITIPPSPS
jgi:hypothetical protein